MSEFPLGYERVPPTTWAYLSSLLLLAVFFKFNRSWSIRNVDLILIILLAPGLLFVHFGAVGRERVRSQIAEQLIQVDAAADKAATDKAAAEIETNDAENSAVESPTDRSSEGSSEGSSNGASDSTDEPSTDGVVERAAAAANGDAEKRLSEITLDATPLETPLEDLPGRNPRFDSIRQTWADAYFKARQLEHRGYLWLFLVSTLILIRMLIDPMMVRRPLLEPNLTSGGLTFMGSSMLVFIAANLLTVPPVRFDLYHVPEIEVRELWPEAEAAAPSVASGPGYRLLSRAPILPTLVDTNRAPFGEPTAPTSTATAVLTRIVVTLSLLAVVVGMLLVGYLHFENFRMGVGIATLFLMLPYTVQMTGRVSHILPAALLVWALVAYRMPLISGLFIGSACGLVYYPLFLLPLWSSFYRQRGMIRFWMGCGISLTVLSLLLWIVGDSELGFIGGLREMFGLWLPKHKGLAGIWALGWEPVFRLPIIAGSVAIAGAMALWPSRKNLGTLMSGSCAVMVGVQFWQGYGGGLSMAWFLPLALLAIFRPNLEEKTAINSLRGSRALRAAANGGKAEK